MAHLVMIDNILHDNIPILLPYLSLASLPFSQENYFSMNEESFCMLKKIALQLHLALSHVGMYLSSVGPARAPLR